jgi:hypothetical protein
MPDGNVAPPPREILVAARWWGNQLRHGAEHNTGDLFNDAIANTFAGVLPRSTEEQVAIFERELVRVWWEDQQKNHNWPPDVEGDVGWATRYIDTDYHPGYFLQSACAAAGIKGMLLLPMKTIMRVDPGRVQVAMGYGESMSELPLEGEGVDACIPSRRQLTGATWRSRHYVMCAK